MKWRTFGLSLALLLGLTVTASPQTRGRVDSTASEQALRKLISPRGFTRWPPFPSDPHPCTLFEQGDFYTNTTTAMLRFCDGTDWQDIAVASGTISGTGTAGRIPLWSSAAILTDSILSQTGTTVNVPDVNTLSFGPATNAFFRYNSVEPEFLFTTDAETIFTFGGNARFSVPTAPNSFTFQAPPGFTTFQIRGMPLPNTSATVVTVSGTAANPGGGFTHNMVRISPNVAAVGAGTFNYLRLDGATALESAEFVNGISFGNIHSNQNNGAEIAYLDDDSNMSMISNGGFFFGTDFIDQDSNTGRVDWVFEPGIALIGGARQGLIEARGYDLPALDGDDHISIYGTGSQLWTTAPATGVDNDFSFVRSPVITTPVNVLTASFRSGDGWENFMVVEEGVDVGLFRVPILTAQRIYTFPDVTGTVAVVTSTPTILTKHGPIEGELVDSDLTNAGPPLAASNGSVFSSTPTMNAMIGGQTQNFFDLAPVFATHTGSSNIFNMIKVPAIVAQVGSRNSLIETGTGWDFLSFSFGENNFFSGTGANFTGAGFTMTSASGVFDVDTGGVVTLHGGTGGVSLIQDGGGSFQSTLAFATATGNTTVTIPAITGTVALLAGTGTTNRIPRFTPDGSTLGDGSMSDDGVGGITAGGALGFTAAGELSLAVSTADHVNLTLGTNRLFRIFDSGGTNQVATFGDNNRFTLDQGPTVIVVGANQTIANRGNLFTVTAIAAASVDIMLRPVFAVEHGQIVTLYFDNGNVTINDSGTAGLEGTFDLDGSFTGSTGAVLTVQFIPEPTVGNDRWVEVSRSPTGAVAEQDLVAQGSTASNPPTNQVRFYVDESTNRVGAAPADCVYVARLSSGVEINVAILVTDGGCP